MTSSQVLLHNESYTFAYFFWILSIIKMKFGQILACCLSKISNMFLGQCCRLGTSSRLFYYFIKMTIYWDLAIFNGRHLPFANVDYSTFQKMKRCNLDIIGYWIIGAGSKLKRTWNLVQVFKIVPKIPKNYCPYFYQLVKFGDLMSRGCRDVFKNAPFLMY